MKGPYSILSRVRLPASCPATPSHLHSAPSLLATANRRPVKGRAKRACQKVVFFTPRQPNVSV